MNDSLQLVKGRNALVDLLSNGDLDEFAARIHRLPTRDGHTGFFSRNESINSYLAFLASRRSDLGENDKRCLQRMIDRMGWLEMVQQGEQRLLGDKAGVLLAVSNNVFNGDPGVWYSQGDNRAIYTGVRKTYSKVANRFLNHKKLRRLEVFSRSQLQRESPDYAVWLMLHLWEEFRINGTEVSLLDIDDIPAYQQQQIRNLDMYLVLNSEVQHSLLYTQTGSVGKLDQPSSAKSVQDHIDIFNDPLIRRNSRPLNPGEFSAICGEWGGVDFVALHKQWDSVLKKSRGAAISSIIAGLTDQCVPAAARNDSGAPLFTFDEVLAVAGENGGKILQLAKDIKLTVDDKIRLICELDRRFRGYSSTEWQRLLGVSSAAVRATQAWKRE